MAANEQIKTIEEHIEDVTRFSEVREDYKSFAKILEEILRRAGDLYAPMAIVQARAKTISSFAEKIIRKNKYKEPLQEITDLCGARIVTHFQSEADKLCEFIKANFKIDEANSIDVSSRLKYSEFGYLSIHYIVTPKQGEILGVAIPEKLKKLKAEIQVRTILQHAWADICHDRIYKATISVPKKWRRESSRIAAVLEKADEAFADMAETLDSYSSDYGIFLCEEKLEDEIKTLRAILEAEPDKIKKQNHALRLAKALSVNGEWGSAVDTLKPYKDIAMKENTELLLELAYVLCELNKNQIQSQDYKEGQRILNQIAKPDESLQDIDKYSSNKLDKEIEICHRAQAFYLLGESWGRIEGKEKKAKQCFYNAYQLLPKNPYYFTTLMEYEVFLNRNSNFLSLIQPGILETIALCKTHANIGVELPRAFFTIGKCYFMLKKYDDCINSYAKVVDLVISNQACVSLDLLDKEMASIQRLQKINPEYAELVSIMLHLLRWRKYGKEDSKELLESKRLQKEPFKEPVCIIAGGAAEMDDRTANKYYDYLRAALEGFKGTVISGGTTSGIPGEVGAVASRFKGRKKKQFKLISYLPSELPADAIKDDRYDLIIQTDAKEFSARELVAYWTDLLLSNVDPEQVLVLGINGGRISDMEYRFALAFGANVGLVENSGRAATGLLADPDWNMHKRIIVLPEDKLTIWAFVQQNQPSVLTEEEINESAPKVHQYYLEKKIRDRDTDDPSMLPWEQLNEDLRNSNRKQIEFMERVISKVGLKIRKSEQPIKYDIDNDNNIINEMAEMEHARWLVERMSEGWVYGAKKDIENKINPSLVGWDKLTEKTKSYDIEAVKRFQEVLNQIGYEIYKS